MATATDLSGQTVVILRGSSGIGLATAHATVALGARVAIVARDPARLADAAAGLGADVVTHSADVGEEPAIADRFAAYEHVDHVLLSAGEPLFGTVSAMDLQQARDWIDERVRTLLFVARHAGPRLTPGGSLTLLSASGLRRPSAGGTLAGAWGSSTEQIAQTLALELAPARVNVIAPGFVDTPLAARLLGERLDDRRRALAQALPIGRVVGAADVAALACHLMLNTAITGAIIPVDGGQVLA